MAYSNLTMLDLFGDLQTSNDMINGKNGYESMVNNEFEHYTQFCGPCVGTAEKKNCIMIRRSFCYGIVDGE